MAFASVCHNGGITSVPVILFPLKELSPLFLSVPNKHGDIYSSVIPNVYLLIFYPFIDISKLSLINLLTQPSSRFKNRSFFIHPSFQEVYLSKHPSSINPLIYPSNHQCVSICVQHPPIFPIIPYFLYPPNHHPSICLFNHLNTHPAKPLLIFINLSNDISIILI